MNKAYSVLIALLMVGCTTTSPDKEVTTDKVAAVVTSPTPHPVEPDWVTFTEKPIVKKYKIGDDLYYEVTDQFVERSLQLQDYADRIKKWKRKNLVP